MQWYINRPSDTKPDLYSYRLVAQKTADMTEHEKLQYLQETKEILENICTAGNIALLTNNNKNEIDCLSAEQLEIFKKWYPYYQNGDYIVYTDSLDKELSLITELYQEAASVTNYAGYLQKIKENREVLNGISIFSDNSTDNFSSRNIEKSYNDYKDRTDTNIKWFPSKGIVSSMDNQITGLLLIISSFLLSVWGLLEEKEKGLFYITRATKYGIFQNITARIISLWLSCVFFSAILYGSSCAFYYFTSGLGNLKYDIQSVSEYMQSCYSLNVGSYMLISVFSKAMVIFCFGLFLQFIAIICRKKIMPFLIGIIVLASSALMYIFMPSVGVLNCLKYSNIIGFFHTENLYGDYLNYDIGGYPVSRTFLSVMLLLTLIIICCIAVFISFYYGKNLYFKQSTGKIKIWFKPHVSIFRHECYKIFIANHALYILTICIIAAGYHNCSHSYLFSTQEQYYKDLMLKLEGKLNDEKETLLLSEKKRYDNAMKQLDKIDELEAQGQMNSRQADEQRDILNATLAFYKPFKRAWNQYEYIKNNNGNLVYDTGYLYLLGIWGDNFLITLLIFIVCFLLVFCNSVSIDYQNSLNLLINSSALGMKSVLWQKTKICILVGILLPVCIWSIRILHINNTMPLHYWNNKIHIISSLGNVPVNMPIWCFVLLAAASQILISGLVSIFIMFLSYRRKNYIQAMFLGALIFLAPLILYTQGFEFMKYLTVYPFFTWFAL